MPGAPSRRCFAHLRARRADAPRPLRSCCPQQPIHAGYLQQKPAGVVGMMESLVGAHAMETIQYNTWAGGLPPQLTGRVDPIVWAQFINAISVLCESQPNCCVQCLTCGCAASARNVEAGLQAITASYAGPLGAAGFSHLQYQYYVWVPPEGGENPQPGRWEQRSIDYLQVRFNAPFAMMAAAPMMAPPPGATMNPMMYAQQPPPPQMYAQQQPPQMMYAQQ